MVHFVTVHVSNRTVGGRQGRKPFTPARVIPWLWGYLGCLRVASRSPHRYNLLMCALDDRPNCALHLCITFGMGKRRILFRTIGLLHAFVWPHRIMAPSKKGLEASLKLRSSLRAKSELPKKTSDSARRSYNEVTAAMAAMLAEVHVTTSKPNGLPNSARISSNTRRARRRLSRPWRMSWVISWPNWMSVKSALLFPWRRTPMQSLRP